MIIASYSVTEIKEITISYLITETQMYNLCWTRVSSSWSNCQLFQQSRNPRATYALAFLTMLLTSACAGGQILGVPHLHRRERDYELATNRVEDQENRNTLSGDDLYLGYSGDPWESVSSGRDCHYKNPRQARSSFSKHSAMFNNSWTKQISWLDAGRHLRGARFKRGVIHLYNMVVCATGCDPLDYKGYGCYCGFLGSGYTIDGIDRCCKMHDWCYDATECPMFLEYFVPYYWKCHRGYKPICAIEHGEWGSSGSCAQRLCECDRSLAECLSRYPCPKTKAVCMSSPWRLVQNLFMIL